MNANQTRPISGHVAGPVATIAATKRGQPGLDRLLPCCTAGDNPQTLILHSLVAKRAPDAGQIIGRANDDNLHHRRMAGKIIDTVTEHRLAAQIQKLFRRCPRHAAARTGGNNHRGDGWRHRRSGVFVRCGAHMPLIPKGRDKVKAGRK